MIVVFPESTLTTLSSCVTHSGSGGVPFMLGGTIPDTVILTFPRVSRNVDSGCIALYTLPVICNTGVLEAVPGDDGHHHNSDG